MGRVIFLGTGDSVNEERVQTSLAIRLPGGETILLDVASGTDILRQVGAAGIPLQSIRHLFISHRHFDHAGGLAPMLMALVPLPKASITVHATRETLENLRKLLDLTMPGVEGWLGDRLAWGWLAPGRPVEVGGARITPFEVDHGIACVGFRVWQPRACLVFAADTRPCENTIEYARDADLLVHEAFSLNDGAKWAHVFGHSTAEEAGRVARKAGARRLVLTHLRSSTFIDPTELVSEAEAAFGKPVRAARDFDHFEFWGQSAGVEGGPL